MPYLPLPDHKMDYYLAIPVIGIALLGAYAIAALRTMRLPARCGRLAVVALYAGTLRARLVDRHALAACPRRTWKIWCSAWKKCAPREGKIILLDGVDTDLFWSGVADLPFRAKAMPSVYLAPGSEARVQAAPELLSKYTLPAAIARTALAAAAPWSTASTADSARRNRARRGALWTEDQPHFVNLGDPVFAEYVGSGWGIACRRVPAHGSPARCGSERREVR